VADGGKKGFEKKGRRQGVSDSKVKKGTTIGECKRGIGRRAKEAHRIKGALRKKFTEMCPKDGQM